jgi:hypothetical protein
MYPGIVKGDFMNEVGMITVLDTDSKKIKINTQTIVLCDDNDCIKVDFKTMGNHMAKIIVDSLPVEYHLYDLKTTFC